MSKFIMTKDDESRQILKDNKLKEVSKAYGIYVFLNEPNKMRFDKSNLKITYTNKISI